jgi:hypothetical protein
MSGEMLELAYIMEELQQLFYNSFLSCLKKIFFDFASLLPLSQTWEWDIVGGPSFECVQGTRESKVGWMDKVTHL